MLSRSQTLRDIATQLPRSIAVFEELRLDFCCRGARSLGEACSELGLDPDAVVTRLTAIEASTADDPTPAQFSTLHALINHIVERHHRFVRDSFATLKPLMSKVLRVHGPDHPELEHIARTFAGVVAELEPHQMREEGILFPAIIAIEKGEGASLPMPVEHPIHRMQADHEILGELLRQLSQQTNSYAPPDGACTSWRALYAGFAEFERDVHLHIHLENNVLFPRVLALT